MRKERGRETDRPIIRELEAQEKETEREERERNKVWRELGQSKKLR